MDRKEIFEKLKEILAAADEQGAAKLEKLDESANLFTDLGLSSVNILYIVIASEEVFGIRYDDVGANDFQTVGDVVSYIEGKL